MDLKETIEIWKIKLNQINDEIKRAAPNLMVEYSAYKHDENGAPINNLNEIAIQGQVIVVADRDERWGGPSSKSYRSGILKNPTWLTLLKQSDKMVRQTGDRHHIFFENFEVVDERNGVKYVELHMGS